MSEIAVYNLKGENVGKVNLIPEIFEVPDNDNLVHQISVAQMANSRCAIANTKDRSEMRGGGKKPWAQKGTGRARHGSIRSPLWRGGGVTFGPTSERNFSKKVNKKMKNKALNIVLSGKVRDNELIVLESFKLESLKTKIVAEAMKNLKAKVETLKDSKDNDKFIIALGKNERESVQAIKNIKGLHTISYDSLNIVDLLSNKYLILTKESLNSLQGKM